MATLENKLAKNTYKDLLKINSASDNAGIDGTLRAVEDGDATASALQISSAGIKSTGTLEVSGNATFDTNTLYVDATNNRVGIGTSTPAYPLDISGFANSTSGFRTTNGTIDTRLSWSSGNVGFIGMFSNHPLGIYSGGDEHIRITSAGDVGIGTTTPNISVGSGKALTLSSIYTRSRIELQNTAGDTGGNACGTINYYNGVNSIAEITATSDVGSAVAGFLTISTNSTERMRISSAGYVGIGTTTPSYQLHLSTDSAAKPTSNTWTISSDERIKENIENANLQTCFENIKNLKLKRFNYKPEVFSNEQVKDRGQLGLIAQEVEPIFPKSISKNDLKYNQKYEDVIIAAKFDENGIEIEKERIEKKLISEDTIVDCYGLDSSQIIWALYGAVQLLIQKVEALESK